MGFRHVPQPGICVEDVRCGRAYTVILTVTDDVGQTGIATQTVTVGAGAGGGGPL